MNYRSGEQPIVGDAVRGPEDRLGTVLQINRCESGLTEPVIIWQDRTVGIHHLAADLSLIRRSLGNSGATAGSDSPRTGA